MNEGYESKITIGGLAFGIFQFVFMVVMISLFVGVLRDDDVVPQIEFSDGAIFDEIEGLPEGATSDLERSIYNVVAMNTDNDFEIASSGAIVREGSLVKTYFAALDIYYIYFIIDIPEIGQSYQMKYEWSDNEDNPYLSVNERLMAMCPSDEQLIYGGFNCVDSYNKNGASLILYAYISNNKFNGFDVVLPKYFNQDVVIRDFEVKLKNVTGGVAVQELKKYIRALGFDAEVYNYSIVNE